MSTAATASSTPNPVQTPAPLPALARRLGYAGLLPFVLGSFLVWLVHEEVRVDVARGLATYAGVVVSFLGAMHWGLAMRVAQPPTALLAWGVAPALVAWLGVMMPPDAGLVLLGAMLLGCYAMDRRLYPAQGVAHWLTLRFRLSTLAALSCFIAAAGS